MPSFWLPKKNCFSSFLKDIFIGYIFLGWWLLFFFIQHLKNVIPLSFGFHSFWWKLYHHKIAIFVLYSNVSFFSGCLWDLFFDFCFQLSEYDVWVCVCWISGWYFNYVYVRLFDVFPLVLDILFIFSSFLLLVF